MQEIYGSPLNPDGERMYTYCFVKSVTGHSSINMWLYCQHCEEVMEAVDGYFEGDSHSCWNGSGKNDKIPKLLKLTPQRIRKEIESCRAEIVRIRGRVKQLLQYKRKLNGSAT
jgi:hypothetical protein